MIPPHVQSELDKLLELGLTRIPGTALTEIGPFVVTAMTRLTLRAQVLTPVNVTRIRRRSRAVDDLFRTDDPRSLQERLRIHSFVPHDATNGPNGLYSAVLLGEQTTVLVVDDAVRGVYEPLRLLEDTQPFAARIIGVEKGRLRISNGWVSFTLGDDGKPTEAVFLASPTHQDLGLTSATPQRDDDFIKYGPNRTRDLLLLDVLNLTPIEQVRAGVEGVYLEPGHDALHWLARSNDVVVNTGLSHVAVARPLQMITRMIELGLLAESKSLDRGDATRNRVLIDDQGYEVTVTRLREYARSPFPDASTTNVRFAVHNPASGLSFEVSGNAAEMAAAYGFYEIPPEQIIETFSSLADGAHDLAAVVESADRDTPQTYRALTQLAATCRQLRVSIPPSFPYSLRAPMQQDIGMLLDPAFHQLEHPERIHDLAFAQREVRDWFERTTLTVPRELRASMIDTIADALDRVPHTKVQRWSAALRSGDVVPEMGRTIAAADPALAQEILHSEMVRLDFPRLLEITKAHIRERSQSRADTSRANTSAVTAAGDDPEMEPRALESGERLDRMAGFAESLTRESTELGSRQVDGLDSRRGAPEFGQS